MGTARFVFWLGVACVCACADVAPVGELCPTGRCDDGSRDAQTPSNAPGPENPPQTTACSGGELELSRRRLDVYMMVDDSASMLLVWPDTLLAIEGFLRDPASSGLGVGLQFFGTSCDASVYATPRVAIAPLPGNVDRLMAAFPAIPLNETATLPAIQGAVTHAKDWIARYPNRDVAVLFITDGLPDECESTVDNVAAVARTANQGQPSIPTYVVVIGDIGALNLLSSEGGTGDARLATPNSVPELVNALNDVRNSARSCAFTRLDGGALRADALSVMREQADGTRMLVPQVLDESRCDAQLGGFYLDGGSVQLCPEVCASLGPDRIRVGWEC